MPKDSITIVNIFVLVLDIAIYGVCYHPSKEKVKGRNIWLISKEVQAQYTTMKHLSI